MERTCFAIAWLDVCGVEVSGLVWSTGDVEAGVSGGACTSNGSDFVATAVAACEASNLSRLSTAVGMDVVCPIFCKHER